MRQLMEEMVKDGRLEESQLHYLRQKRSQDPFHGGLQFFLETTGLHENMLSHYLQSVHQIPTVDPCAAEIDLALLVFIPYETAVKYVVLPILQEEETLCVAMCEPLNLRMLDDLRTLSGFRIKPFYASRSRIEAAIEKNYHQDEVAFSSFRKILTRNGENQSRGDVMQNLVKVHDVTNGSSPLIKLVNHILSTAVRRRASDIHIEPQSDSVHVRIRVDGYLQPLVCIPNSMQNSLAARIKILSNLNIAERRKPQDGRTAMLLSNRKKIDVRVSVTPTFYGEKIVMRLLDCEQARIHFDKIGLTDELQEKVAEAISVPQGMILVTGPTGSGKTSTLYAILNQLKQGGARNITTIEDPIEYLMDGVNQIQLNSMKDVTFAKALRSILRQDPDIIFVGEIRDQETAQIALRASLTGHLVFSTLHTTNSVASISRLLDIGIEPYLIASSLEMIIAQRLVRKNCPECLETYTPSPAVIEKFSAYIETHGIKEFVRGKGCRHCNNTGFYGRSAVFEILKMNSHLASLISNRADEKTIFEEARRVGLESLAHAGVEKVAKGGTTLEEVNYIIEIPEIEKEFLEKIR